MRIVTGLKFHSKDFPEIIYTVSNLNFEYGKCAVKWDARDNPLIRDREVYRISDVLQLIKDGNWIVTYTPNNNIKLYKRILNIN